MGLAHTCAPVRSTVYDLGACIPVTYFPGHLNDLHMFTECDLDELRDFGNMHLICT